jgi:predicted enzyme related to lactoylglutathione lyase
MTNREPDAWPTGIGAITLFVEYVPAAKEFYRTVFRLPVHYEDADSAVFKFGDRLVNRLKATEAAELIEPEPVAPPNAGSRFQLTINVADVDATCAELERRGRPAPQRPDRPTVGRPNRRLPRSGRARLGGSLVLGRPIARRSGDRLLLFRPSV